MRITLATISILIQASIAMEVGVRTPRKLEDDSYYYYYYYPNTPSTPETTNTEKEISVTPALMNEVECTCAQDSEKIFEDRTQVDNILSSLYSNKFRDEVDLAFNMFDEDGFKEFDDLCGKEDGFTVNTTISFQACVGNDSNYKNYPACIPRSCGGTDDDTALIKRVLENIIRQGPIQYIGNDGCIFDVDYEYLNETPLYQCGYQDEGEIITAKTECEVKAEALFNAPFESYNTSFKNLQQSMVDTATNKTTFVYNNDDVRLVRYIQECDTYEGKVNIVNIQYDDACPQPYTFKEVPICFPNICEDMEAAEFLNNHVSDGIYCNIDSKFVGNYSVREPTKSTKSVKSSSQSKKMKKIKKKRAKSSSDEYDSAQCTLDLQIIYGDENGISPQGDREFVLENMVECPEDEDFPCVYNGNSTALEKYTDYCNSVNDAPGRVVQTDWLFSDECTNSAGWSDRPWAGIYECFPSSCGDDEVREFFDSIYYDASNPMCDVDVSIAHMVGTKSGKAVGGLLKKKRKRSKSASIRASTSKKSVSVPKEADHDDEKSLSKKKRKKVVKVKSQKAEEEETPQTPTVTKKKRKVAKSIKV